MTNRCDTALPRRSIRRTAADQARRWLLRRADAIFAMPTAGCVPEDGKPPGPLYCWLLLLLSKHAVDLNAVMPELLRLNAGHGGPFAEALLRRALQEASEARALVGGLPRQRPSKRGRAVAMNTQGPGQRWVTSEP